MKKLALTILALGAVALGASRFTTDPTARVPDDQKGFCAFGGCPCNDGITDTCSPQR